MKGYHELVDRGKREIYKPETIESAIGNMLNRETLTAERRRSSAPSRW